LDLTFLKEVKKKKKKKKKKEIKKEIRRGEIRDGCQTCSKTSGVEKWLHLILLPRLHPKTRYDPFHRQVLSQNSG
jgi:hypothetical protein